MAATSANIPGQEWMVAQGVDRTLFDAVDPPDVVLARARARLAPIKASAAPQAGDAGFTWGLAHWPNGTTDLSRRRIEVLREFFNGLTAKCYWDERWHQPIEHEEGLRITDVFRAELDFAESLGLRVRGHPLLWTVPKAIPAWLFERHATHAERWRTVERHVREMVRIGRGRVACWDVVNEALWEPVLANVPRRTWPHIEPIDAIADDVAQVIRWAREEDPQAKLVVNDYGLETMHVTGPGVDVSATAQRQRLIALCDALRDRGAGPDAVATQMHDGTWCPPGVFKRVLDDLARAAPCVHVSEFWARGNPGPGEWIEAFEARRVAYVEACVTIARSHPACEHFTLWESERTMFVEDSAEPSPVLRTLQTVARLN